MFPYRVLLLSLTVLFLAAPMASAEEYEHHALLRLHIDSPDVEAWIEENAGQLDIAGGRRGEYIDLVVRHSEVGSLVARGGDIETIHEDMESFYASRIGDRDYGAYHTYSENVAWMDALRLNYPDAISEKWSIGQGHEGNHIWCFRVSDNPDIDEDFETEVLFDGEHHAREIMASEMPMMLAEYLCEQYYAGDPEIVQLLEENEIYFVPMVNPDGMLYNEQTNPNGGGMWRKNRSYNDGGTRGVDPNRNYPYEWGCDWGSSGDPGSETYRGPSPASEPEVQAMIALVNAHEFVTRQSFHTYGELTLYPWGYTTADTPDEDIFREMAAAMVQYNGYTPGQPGDVLYDVCGGTFDWDYGAQDEHAKIFGFTNEIGTSFWPPDSHRQPMFDDNLWPSLYMIQISSELRGVTWTHQPVPFSSNSTQPYELIAIPQGYEGAPIDAATVLLHYRVDGGGFLDQLMLPTGEPGEFGASIPAQAEGAIVEYFLSANDVEGNSGTSPRGAPDALHYFEIGTEFEHAMEADRGWTVGDAGDDASTGIWVRVDPVGTAAQPEDDHSADGTQCWVTGQHLAGQGDGYNDVDGGKTTLLSPAYDFSGAEELTFAYWKWYSNDQGNNPNSDWWDVLLSNDGGATWTQIEHTTTSTNAWASMAFNLFDYFVEAGTVQLKFVASDESPGSVVEAAVDDFSIAGVFDPTGSGDLPLAFRVELDQNYPNPFNPLTSIRFRLPEAGPVGLGVYDTRGRMVKSLIAEELPAGEHAVTWNGRDALGRPAASGVYFVKLRSAHSELSRRMVLVK